MVNVRSYPAHSAVGKEDQVLVFELEIHRCTTLVHVWDVCSGLLGSVVAPRFSAFWCLVFLFPRVFGFPGWEGLLLGLLRRPLRSPAAHHVITTLHLGL